MKVLIYRISSIGDIILTTPVLRCLRKQYPDFEIHYITRKRYADLLSSNPYISKLWLIKKSPLEIVNELKAENTTILLIFIKIGVVNDLWHF